MLGTAFGLPNPLYDSLLFTRQSSMLMNGDGVTLPVGADISMFDFNGC